MLNAAIIMSAEDQPNVYNAEVLARLQPRVARLTLITPARRWREHTAELPAIDVLFSGWGPPVLDHALLAHMPRLQAVFYAGGGPGHFTPEAFWQRGIRLTTAQAINAIPVAEYAASALLLGLKSVWPHARNVRHSRTFPAARPLAGAYRTRVGLVSFGTIGRLVRERLRASDLEVWVHDPYVSAAEAARAGVRLADLDALFAGCDAVSVHTPHLPETTGLIRGRHLASMKPGAFFLNTARGEIIVEAEMVAVLQQRPDLQAMLDVTAPEPPLPDSPLYSLPNVVLTPHIAGSIGPECARLGHAMVDEFERYCAGAPLRWEVRRPGELVTHR